MEIVHKAGDVFMNPPPVACGDDIDRMGHLGSWAQNDAQLAMGGIGEEAGFCGMDNIRDLSI